MNVIAERSLILRINGADTLVTFRLGKPEQDDRYSSWVCSCEVGVGDDVRTEATHGADSLQALQLALAGTDAFLKRVVEDYPGELLHEGEPFISLFEASSLVVASK